jgi:RHS repeat-associated protein
MKDQEGEYPVAGQVSSDAGLPSSPAAPVTWWDDEYSYLFEIQNLHGRDPRRPRRPASRSQILNVNAGTGQGNYLLPVPLLDLPGRNLDLSLNLYYNSSMWTAGPFNPKLNIFDRDQGWPAPGWSLGFGQLVWTGDYPVLQDADGTLHPWVVTETGQTTYAHTADGTLIDYQANLDAGTAQAQYPDGTTVSYGAKSTRFWYYGSQVYPTQILDANGNFISIQYVKNSGPYIQSITDTVGRTINFCYDRNNPNLLTAITAPGLNGTTRTVVRFNYSPLNIPPSGGFIYDFPAQGIDAIYFPGTSTGYWFGDPDSYTADSGIITKVSQRRGMTLDPGTPLDEQGAITKGLMTRERVYNYDPQQLRSVYTTMTESWEAMDTPPAVTTFAVTPGNTTFIDTIYPDQTKVSQWLFNDPKGAKWAPGLLWQTRTYDPAGALLRQTENTWELGDYDSPRITAITETDQITEASPGGQSKSTTYTYGSYSPTENQLWQLVPDPAGSGYSFIQSKLNGYVIDILNGSTQPQAPLDAYPQKTTGTDNQLWRLIPDPAFPGYFFIQSKLNGYMIDIPYGSNSQPQAPLDASPLTTTSLDNQLWRLVPDPAGSGYSSIQSKLNGSVIDILNGSTQPEAPLDASQKSTNLLTDVVQYDYQVPGSQGQPPVLRSTHTDYVSDSGYAVNHIFNLPQHVYVRDQANVIVSRTDYAYDHQPLDDAPGVLFHLNLYNPYSLLYDPRTANRGNVTEITRYADAAAATNVVVESRRYDITGNLTAVSGTACQQTTITYDPGAQSTQYAYPSTVTCGSADPTSPVRLTRSFTYDPSNGLPVTGTDPNGRTTQYTYDTGSLRVTRVMLPTGARIEYSYDDEGMSANQATYFPDGVVAAETVTRFNGLGLVNQADTSTDGSPNTVATQYDALGRLWKRSQPYQAGPVMWTTFSLDALGRMTSVQAPDGAQWTWHYDEPQRPNSASAAPGQTVRIQSPDIVSLTKRIPGADRWYRTDALGQLAEVVEPNAYASPPGSVFGPGNVIDILNGSTQPAAALDAFPQKTTGTDNQLWRVIPDPAGSGYSFIQSKLNGNVIDILNGSAQPAARLDAFPQKTTGTDNQLWRLIPDPAGSGYSSIQSKLNGNVKTSYSYNGLGLLQAVQGTQGQERRFQYDSLGRLTAQYLPEKSATLDGTGAYTGSGGLWSDAFTYDNRSNLTSHTDARGVKTTYDYAADPLDPIDPLNRLSRISYEFTGPADPSIQPTAPADYTYMATGDVTRPYQVTTSPIGSDQAVHEYGYDTEGRLASTQLTWPTAGPAPLVLQLDYEYDALNRLTGKTYPAQSEAAGRKNVAYSYDLSGQSTGVQIDGTDYASQLTYNPANQATSITVGPTGSQQTVETFAYDPATNLLASQQVKRGNTVLLDLAYSYLPNGQLDTLTEGGGKRQFTYLYDALDRLWKMTKAAGADGPEWGEEYTFDELGNRIAVKASGKLNGAPAPPDGLPALTYDPATNHITTAGFSYDPAGNQTRARRADGSWLRYKYDQAGRLTEVTDDNQRALESYGYNSAGKRLVTRHGTENTYYFWDGGQVITEHTQPLPTDNPTWSKSLVYLGNRLLATFQPGLPGELVDYHHPDRLGTRLITNSTNNTTIEQTTLPFGSLIPGEPKHPVNPIFTTYDRSAITGVDYAVNRYYNLGRFTQADPAGISSAGMMNPQSLNLYTYALNNPINLTDPDGLDWVGQTICDHTDTPDGEDITCVGVYSWVDDTTDSSVWVISASGPRPGGGVGAIPSPNTKNCSSSSTAANTSPSSTNVPPSPWESAFDNPLANSFANSPAIKSFVKAQEDPWAALGGLVATGVAFWVFAEAHPAAAIVLAGSGVGEAVAGVTIAAAFGVAVGAVWNNTVTYFADNTSIDKWLYLRNNPDMFTVNGVYPIPYWRQVCKP